MINVTVATKFGTTETIPFENPQTVEFFVKEVATQKSPERIFYTFKRYVKVKSITKVISVEEEN